MSNLKNEAVLEVVTRFYLDSRDFNGIPASGLTEELGVEWQDLNDILADLIDKDKVGILYSDAELNTHIIRTGFEPKDRQIAKLVTKELHHSCIYPRPSHLEQVVDRSKYIDRPYVLCLALGAAQLDYRSFDLSVLEYYRQDPRYVYENDDVRGSISIRDEYYESDQIKESDQILLETFGFSYDSDLNRAVAVFLRYLANFSPEHQQIWKAKELTGDYRLHPDYYRNSIIGNWGEGLSVFDAFLIEMSIINQMAEAMERPVLFENDYKRDKPRNFSFLIRPTLEEFNNFVHLLDKMISDNINKKFFRKEVPYEIEIERKDGKIQVQQKGTIIILEDWIRKFYATDDWNHVEQMISTFKKIRKMRQKPAHTVDENVFDQTYFKEQRQLIIDAYGAIRTLRMMFQNYPKVKEKGIEVPDYLTKGKIWTK